MIKPYYEEPNPNIKIYCGDCLEVMKEIPDNSIDAVVTDPPYFLEFMNKEWDKVSLIEPAFGYWFSGFVDGEGCFRIHKIRNGDYYECHFQIKLRKDDRAILEKIQNILGFGRIQDNLPEGNSEATSSYLVNSKNDCFKLAELFFRFPLQAKKQRDFFKWHEALINWKYQKKGNRWHGKPDVSAMEKNWQEMKEIREYRENPIPINKQEFFHYLWAKEVLRVLKPGGYLLSFGSPRTSHRMVCGIEDAGLEIRDMIEWVYGQGFPKSLDIGKAIDKTQRNKRKIIGKGISGSKETHKIYNMAKLGGSAMGGEFNITKGNSKWEGWGTALKPAHEPICLARKPLSEKTIAENILKWGTGGINIDGCRISTNDNTKREWQGIIASGSKIYAWNKEKIIGQGKSGGHSQGRFPANLILECICDEVIDTKIKGHRHSGKPSPNKKVSIFGNVMTGNTKCYTDNNGNEKTIIHTNPGCPCYMLDRQSGERSFGNKQGGYSYKGKHYQVKGFIQNNSPQALSNYGDTGGASRFFYQAKVSGHCDIENLKIGGERHLGCEKLFWLESKQIDEDTWMKLRAENLLRKKEKGYTPHKIQWGNIHPTCKPVSLVKYLIRLITPPKGIVLDMFMGSGSTGMACKELRYNFVGIEIDKDYTDIAVQRLKNTTPNLL